MKIGIVGFGRFGRYMSSKLPVPCVPYDVADPATSLESAASQPVVVFAVPMRRLRESLY
jgi:prephenate dehydrogenase